MKTAVLVIDMIKGMEEFMPKREITKLFPTIKKVLDKARAKEIPVIYTIHTPLGKEGIKIYSEVTPAENDIIIEKTKYSSFYKTKLDDVLKKLGVNRLIITGTATNWCVLSTSLAADYRELNTVLLKDCVAAPSDEWHELAIKWMLNTLEHFEIKTSESIKW